MDYKYKPFSGESKTTATQPTERNLNLVFILISVVVLLVLEFFVPYGRYITYPFTILGTWFHEMGHGLTALLMGGSFEHLEIFADGSGVAYHSGNYGRFARALIAAGGLVGPPIMGAILIVMGKKPKVATWALGILTAFLVISAVIWVRSWFGWLIIPSFAVVFGLLVWKGKPKLHQFVVLFLGAKAALDTVTRMGYLFMESASTGEGEMMSDVGHIQEALFLPYWFWGAILSAFSIALLVLALWFSFRRKKLPEAPAQPNFDV